MELSCSVFDRHQVLEQIGGDEDLLHEVIKVFLVDSPDIRQRLMTSLHARDLKDLHANAHCAKSAVGNFCTKKAVDAAILLEEACKKAETADLDNLTSLLCAALVEVEDALRVEIAD